MRILGRWYLKVCFSGVSMFRQKNMANQSYYSQFQAEKMLIMLISLLHLNILFLRKCISGLQRCNIRGAL